MNPKRVIKMNDHLQKIQCIQRLSELLQIAQKLKLDHCLSMSFIFTMNKEKIRFATIQTLIIIPYGGYIEILPEHSINIQLSRIIIKTDCQP